MRTCTHCHTEKELWCFYFADKVTGRRRARCIACLSKCTRPVAEEGYKFCGKCHNEKLLTFFAIRPSRKSGRHSYCNDCRKLVNNKSRRLVTPDIFDIAFEEQGKRCAICLTTEPGGNGSWCFDHRHGCCPAGKACSKCRRGVLCHRCNLGLGYAKDDMSLLLAMASYLQKWEIKICQ